MSSVSPTSDQLNLKGLLSAALEQPSLQELSVALATGDPPPHPLGVTAPARSFVAAALAQSLARPTLVLTARWKPPVCSQTSCGHG